MGKNSKFSNLGNIKFAASLKDFIAWRWKRKDKKKELTFKVPQATAKEMEYLLINRRETTITWIGHATFLIQVNGINILTDPVWASRMGLEKRLAAPGMPINNMPEIDVILISHNHYDHLDIKTLVKLQSNPLILVPQGLKNFLQKKGFKKVEEFSWWDSYPLGKVEFIFVPAQHWSKRNFWDTNKSHWGGWVIRPHRSIPNKNNIYFVGDSGYFTGFKEIGGKYNISYLLVPIGTYEPEWFMHIQHVTPEQAVRAFLDTGADYFIPMHYDAFRLGDDTPKEAMDRLNNEWQKMHLDASRLKFLKLGETLHLTSH